MSAIASVHLCPNNAQSPGQDAEGKGSHLTTSTTYCFTENQSPLKSHFTLNFMEAKNYKIPYHKFTAVKWEAKKP